MADEDEITDEEAFEGDEEIVDEDPEIEPEDLDEDFEELEEDDETFDDELGEGAEDEDEDEADVSAPRRRASEDEDEDEDLLAPDDVEADLDTILKDRLVTADEGGDDEDEELESDERGGDSDRLQPKRPDEQLCSTCFLLVRRNAPNCPVGDDACPLFPA